MRCGIGIDTHALVSDRPLILGGVRVTHETGLQGHSDADVLTHAIIDALLGAVALGNIGTHFPNTDAQYHNSNSLDLLAIVMTKINKAGYTIGNIDATLCCQEPALSPYILAMRETLSGVMQCSLNQVSVKATTGEYLGFIGRKEGISAHAIALLQATPT